MMLPEEHLEQLHLEDLRNQEHPAIFSSENPDYVMLIVRFPVIKKELTSTSLGFIITKDKSYLYAVQNKALQELEERFEGPHLAIDKVIDELFKGFDNYQEQIADMEESLYTDSTSPGFMTQWLGLKRDILRIERIMSRTAAVLRDTISYYGEEEQFPIHHYTDIHEHSDRILRSSTLQLSKLDYLYNFYNTRTNEKMNKMIFLLTILSAIFLPLNLIVGFFGMNTTALPFSKEAYGTAYVIVLMTFLVVLAASLVYLWRRKTESTR